MSIIAVIPARAGSKGVPYKNRRTIGGKWLVTWALEFALDQGNFDRVVISTDDRKILERYPRFAVLRDARLAADGTRTIEVLRELLTKQIRCVYDKLVLLEPTAPFRCHEDLRLAMSIMQKGNYDSVVSVSEVGDCHPIRVKRRTSEGLLIPYSEEEPEGLRRQEQAPAYIRNGSFYLTKTANILGVLPTLYGDKTYGFVCESPETSINIDTLFDLKLARVVYKTSSTKYLK
jgi:CMP-N,N'-diacetyllegionaminic acid synthase